MDREFSNGYALLIGVDESNIPKLALPDVAKDIDALSGVLVHPKRCAYPTEHVKVIRGQKATRQGIREGLSWLYQQIQTDASGNATVMVYYSGHGWRNESADPPESYLIPYDVREDILEFTALEAEQFARDIAKLNPRRLLVILDCCHAAAMGAKDVGRGMPAGYVEAAVDLSLLRRKEEVVITSGDKGLDALAVGSGRAVLNSSTGEQNSYMRCDGKMSVFTYHLIEALTGHAEPKEGATDVLVSDVMSYVYRKVPQTVKSETGQEQTPDFQVSGNFAVALLLGGKGVGKGQPAPDPLEAVGVRTLPTRIIDTGGGAYIGGNANIGRDLIGRDKIVQGDEVHGDKVERDKTTGDKITVRDISGVGVALGRGAQSAVTQEITIDEFAQAFRALKDAVSAMPASPEKTMAEGAVQGLEAEAAKGDDAQESAIHRWLNFLAETAPDAWQVAVDTFANPVRGISTVFRKIARKAKEDKEPRADP